MSFLFELIVEFIVELLAQLLPHLWPSRPAPVQGRWTVAQYERLYSGYLKLAIYHTVVLTFALGGLWAFGFRILRALVYPDPMDSEILVVALELRWILLALMAGYACALPTSQRLLRATLKHRYPDYVVYRSLKVGHKMRLFYKVIPAILAATVAGFVYHLATTYTAFTEEHVEIHRTFQPTLVFRYHDIVEIRGARGGVTINGKTKAYKNGVYVIEFADGYQWHMWQAGVANDPCGGYRAVAFAAARSGREITGPDLQARCRYATVARPSRSPLQLRPTM